jgi:hypothetical protein
MLPALGDKQISTGLSGLLGNHDVDEFFQAEWEQQPVLIRGAATHLVGTAFTLDQFESLAQAGPANLSVVDGGRARPFVGETAGPSALRHGYAAYASGATLVQSELQLRWPPIAGLCRDVELDLLGRGFVLTEPVAANAYLTPADARGFGIHYDPHCVLVVQLHGRKRWQVYRGTQELPLERRDEPIPQAELGEPLISCSLECGDVLYIPRGFPHVAQTGMASSLHLTVSFRTMVWAEAIADILGADTAFRRSIPPMTGNGSRVAVEGGSLPLQPLIEGLDLAGYLARRRARSLAALEPLPQGRFAAIDGASEIKPDTLVRRVPRMICQSSIDGEMACLSFPGASLRLNAVMRPVFDHVSRVEAFTAQDLPRISANYDAVQLTRLLVQHGLVQPVGARVSCPPPVDDSDFNPVTPETGAKVRAADVFNVALLPGGQPLATHHLGWLHLRQRLSDEECDEIIAICRTFPLRAPTTVDEANHPDHRHADARHLVADAKTSWIFDLIEGVANEATRTTYRFDLTGISRAPQYVEYHAGRGHFSRHNDYSHDQINSPRKLTVIRPSTKVAGLNSSALTPKTSLWNAEQYWYSLR